MEITIVKEQGENHFYTVTIGDKQIETTSTSSDDILVQWLNNIKKLYLNKKQQQKSKLVVGLSCDRNIEPWRMRENKDQPFDALQICIGSHCLVYYEIICNKSYYKKFPIQLKDFLKNRSLEFVGMKMDRVAEKLGGDYGLNVTNASDLNELAKDTTGRDDLGKCGLVKLAKEVIEGGREKYEGINLGGQNRWYAVGDARSRRLSDDKVKFATAESFLCAEIGERCLKMIDDKKIISE